MASGHDRDYLFLFGLACLQPSWTSCASPLQRTSLQVCDHLCSLFEKDMLPGLVLHIVVCLMRRHYHFQNVSIGMAFALALLQHIDLEILISTDSEILHSRSSKTFLRHRLVACADQKGVTVFRSRCIYVPTSNCLFGKLWCFLPDFWLLIEQGVSIMCPRKLLQPIQKKGSMRR